MDSPQTEPGRQPSRKSSSAEAAQAECDKHFHRLCQKGRLREVHQILEQGGHHITGLLQRRVGVHGYTPMHEAARYGHDEILSYLLLFGGDPSALASSGNCTPLHLAAAGGHAKCVRVLLRQLRKADLSLVDSYGRTALHVAELGGRKEVVRLLKSAEVICAASDNSPQLGQMLQGLQADQVDENTFGRALMECAEKGHLDAAVKLVIKGAFNFNQCATKAIEQNHYEVAALLSLCAAANIGDTTSLRAFLQQQDNFNAITINTELTLCGRSPIAVPLAVKEPHLLEIRQVLCDGVVNKMVAAITIALRAKQREAALELLLHLDCNKQSGQVDWHGLALRFLDPSWLSHISHWVVRFLLASNALTIVPRELADCKRLEMLDLCRNALQAIPHDVVQLPVLRNLNLSHNQLHHLPECPWTSTLNSLNVGSNNLCSLPDGLKHTRLTNLILRHNSFSEVPLAVCSLVSLQSLDLSDNRKIRTLPNSMARLKDLMQLNLSSNEISDPPASYLKPAQKCIKYLAHRLRGCMPYYRMKLMVVGLAGKGKSTLAARFLGTDIGNVSTIGIDLSVWYYKKAIFNIWDFAGQEEYYATHQCFMTNRAIYLLLWNIMDGEKGINELRPWLDNIVARAPKSPVLIVATHRDLLTPQMLEDNYMLKTLEKVEQLTLEPQYANRLNVNCITAVSCQKGSSSIDGLKAMVYEAAEQFEYRRDHKVMGESVPASYHKLERLVYQKSEEMAKANLSPILHKKEVCALMCKNGIYDIDNEEELQLMAEFLHEVGSILHYPDRNSGLADLYFIDPRWLYDMMAMVVTVRERNPYIRGGVLRRSNVPMLFRGKRFPADLYDQYLGLLSRFEIALPIDNDHILIPSLLPEEPPSNVPDINSSWSTVPVIRRHHRMIGVPAGFWSRLIARLLQQLQEVLQCLGILSSDWLRTSHSVISSPGSGSLPQPLQISSTAAPTTMVEHGKSSIYSWRHGLCFQHPKLFFMLQPLILPENSMYAGGVETVTSLGHNGRHLMALIVNEIDKLINEWYPGLKDVGFSGDSMQVVVPCTQCTQLGHSQPFIFNIETCAAAVSSGHVKCPSHPDQPSPLADLTPELLFLDLPQQFVLSNDEVECYIDEDSKLGEGRFAIIYRGQVGDKKVAIKTFTSFPRAQAADRIKELHQEVNILKHIAHPYLVGMVGVVLEAQPLQLVLELAPLGSLNDLFLKQQQRLPRMLMHNSAAQVVMALAYLHAQGIVFRDVKSANVLVFSTDVHSDMNVKLTDYGFASVLTPSGTKGFEGTMGFQAPEILQFCGTEEYSSKVDIYSFAIFLYELLTGLMPFWEFPSSAIADSVRSGRRPRLNGVEATQCGLPCWTGLMKQCWRHKAEDRPTAQQAAYCLLDPYAQSFLGCLDIPSSRSVGRAVYVQQTDEVWICCDDHDGTDVIVVKAKAMTMSRAFTISQHQVCAMIVVDGHMVWLGLRSQLGPGMVSVYNARSVRNEPLLTRKLEQPVMALLYCPLPGEEYILASTSDGYLNYMQAHVGRSVLPTMLRKMAFPQRFKVSHHHVNSMVFVGKQIWCALAWFIHVFDSDNSAQSDNCWTASPVEGRQIDCLRVNSDNSLVWSNVFDHWIICGWKVEHAGTCHCIINIKDSLKQTMGSSSNWFIYEPIVTTMEACLDTLWLGLASGHLLVFNQADGMLLSWMRPYTNRVELLVECGSPGPCGLEKSSILSGGQGFCAPQLAKGEALSTEQETDEHQKSLNPPHGGTAVLFEVFTAAESELLQKRSEGLADCILEKYTQAQLPAPSSLGKDRATDIEWDVTGCAEHLLQ